MIDTKLQDNVAAFIQKNRHLINGDQLGSKSEWLRGDYTQLYFRISLMSNPANVHPVDEIEPRILTCLTISNIVIEKSVHDKGIFSSLLDMLSLYNLPIMVESVLHNRLLNHLLKKGFLRYRTDLSGRTLYKIPNPANVEFSESGGMADSVLPKASSNVQVTAK